MICGPYIWAAHTSGSHSLAAWTLGPSVFQDMLDGKLKLEKLPRIHVVLHQGPGEVIFFCWAPRETALKIPKGCFQNDF